MSSYLLSAYKRSRIILWVEDDETRAYLQGVWADPDIGYMMAGGNENVRAVVTDARKQGITHVFGLTDRDLGDSNRAGWLDPSRQIEVFRPEVVEVENWLLDEVVWESLPSPFNPKRRARDDLRQRLHARARAMTWCMATRRVLTEVLGSCGSYPKHPRPKQVADEAGALRWL